MFPRVNTGQPSLLQATDFPSPHSHMGETFLQLPAAEEAVFPLGKAYTYTFTLTARKGGLFTVS